MTQCSPGREEREALRRLYNEVSGCWSSFEYELRPVISNTNYACVQHKLDAAKAILDHPAPAQAAPFYGATCPSYPNCQGGCGLGCRHEVERDAPQSATGTGDLVNRLLAPPVTLKTGQEAAYVIAELEAENKRMRTQPQASHRDAIEQIAVVCTDNMDADCNHRMALDFVRQIANDALSRPERP